MSYPVLQLLSGKEANVGFRHPWVFSGALENIPSDLEHGSLVHVADRNGRIIGTGTFSRKSSIAIRVFEFGEAEIDRAWFVGKFKECDTRRGLMGYGLGTDTTGYRLVFGESDGIPGLVVDRYEDVLVIQISTAGLDALRSEIVEALKSVFKPRAIVERSDLSVRDEENLEDVKGVVHGDDPGRVEFKERGMNFYADVTAGQKTGFFLDQKDLRASVMRHAEGADVLNVFSYSGASGVAAMKGGAKSVHHVDSSEAALALVKEHAALNGIAADAFTSEMADAFQFLGAKEEPSYDMVIIDPPALIKSRRDTEEGKKAYHFINRAAMRLVKDGGILVTSSCSHYMTEDDMAYTLRRASVQAGVTLHVLETVRQSPDHPHSVYFPESAYLKSFVCQVRR